MEQDRLTGLITRSAIAHFIMVRSQLGFAAPDGTKAAAAPEVRAA
jgi:hypothetical protein